VTHSANSEARQPYTEGVYMFPFWLEMSSDGFVFSSNSEALAFIKAFSTSRSKYVSSSRTSLHTHTRTHTHTQRRNRLRSHEASEAAMEEHEAVSRRI